MVEYDTLNDWAGTFEDFYDFVDAGPNITFFLNSARRFL